MKYHSKYEINPADVVDGVINWKVTGNGAFVIGEYGGQKYFIKRYTMGPRLPSRTIPEPIYSEQKAIADSLTTKQEEIRRLFSRAGITIDKDHIVTEEENFWDDNMFTTVTRAIPNEAQNVDYTALDQATFVKLCLDITELIKKAHVAGVTHGDLKEKNVLIQDNSGVLVPYLIDFDSSYPSDYGVRKGADGMPLLKLPVVFSPGYQSPEIAINNFNNEEGEETDESQITNKTDIFTLALIFHRLWTGDFPVVVGDDCPVGEAVYMGTPIKLDSKFDVSLGSNNDCKFTALLGWMLEKDFAMRPTAEQVIEALSDRLDVSDHFNGVGTSSKFELELHSLHKNVVEDLDKDELKAKNVKGFKKVYDAGAYKYAIKMADGSEQRLTIEELIEKGFAKAKPITLGVLFPEDEKTIELVSADEIAKLGIVAVEPKDLGVKKFYFIRTIGGQGYTTSRQGLLSRGIAKPKAVATVTIDADTPWPEHGSAYNQANLAKRNVAKIERVDEGGQHKYRVVHMVDGTEKESIVNIGYIKIMQFI